MPRSNFSVNPDPQPGDWVYDVPNENTGTIFEIVQINESVALLKWVGGQVPDYAPDADQLYPFDLDSGASLYILNN